MKRMWSKEDLEEFGQQVLNWSRNNPRPMPWKNFSDPYPIWIAEIILQQTRVDQGWSYFLHFLDAFPDLRTLSDASIEEVLQVWEGLGYYQRARNLHHTAQYVCHELGGQFPDNSRDLMKLKGIGPYTGAAIASFAFGESIGVVDGNVKRVVSRYFGITEDVNSIAIHRQIQELVNAVVQIYPSPAFNQAIMNFGALACLPRNPLCMHCPARNSCWAFQNNFVDQLPHKSTPRPRQIRWINFGVFQQEGQIALVQNTGANIWNNLYIFPVLEPYHDFKTTIESGKKCEKLAYPLIDAMEWNLTHRKLMIQFYQVAEWPISWQTSEKIQLVDHRNLDNFAIPRPMRLFLKQKSRKLGINLRHD